MTQVLLPILAASALWNIVQGLVMGLFIVTGFLLTVVVLLQEGKGGGIAGAFGGAGAEAFGVKAGTVNRFTAYLGAAFLSLALVHAGISSKIEQPTSTDQPSKLTDDVISPGSTDGSGGSPPGGSTPPASPGSAPGGPVPPDASKPPEPAVPVEKPGEQPKEPGAGPVPPTPAPSPAPAPEQPKEPAPVPPAMGG